MKERLVVGIGEVLWDIFPDGKKLGGAPANFTYHAHKAGMDSVLVSAIGSDALGADTETVLDGKGIRHYLEKVPYPTGTVDVELDENGVAQYDIKRDVAWDNIPFSSHLEDIAARTAAVCFGTLAQRSSVSRETIHSFLDATPAGSYRILDANLRQDFFDKDMVLSSLAKSNVLKINEDEIGIVADLSGCLADNDREICHNLIERFNLRFLIFTCGGAGSHIYSDKEDSFRESKKIDLVDTVGAGDSFTASFISSVLAGRSVAEAHDIATHVSGFVCSCAGGTPDYDFTSIAADADVSRLP